MDGNVQPACLTVSLNCMHTCVALGSKKVLLRDKASLALRTGHPHVLFNCATEQPTCLAGATQGAAAFWTSYPFPQDP